MRHSRSSIAFLALGVFAPLAAFSPRLAAQSDPLSATANYFDQWTDRVVAAQDSQPGWMTPLATTTPRLEQEFRYDQDFESLANGSKVDIYDGGKGLEFIPTGLTEVIISVPPYQVRTNVKPASGFNDWPGILLKYRLLSANEKTGNYVVTVFAQYGLPTGALVYTNNDHIFTPTLAAGKGWEDFDLQATVGESIPTHDYSNTGRAILTNVTAQYHLSSLLWPEVELNRTDWPSGEREGRSQTYLTSGIIVGRIVLHNRSKLIVGVGYQTAISKVYPTSPATPVFNHNWIISVRTTF